VIPHKTLYMLHIPKTGGMSVQLLAQALLEQELPVYPHLPGRPAYTDYAYLQGHFGTQPLDRHPEIELATVVRDPVERAVSTFMWSARRERLTGRDGYEGSRPLADRLRYFLFEDEAHQDNHNLATRFLCNPSAKTSFHDVSEADARAVSQMQPSTWYVTNDRSSLDEARRRLDSAAVLGVTEDLDRFMDGVLSWFECSYGLDLREAYSDLLTRVESASGSRRVNRGLYPDETGVERSTAWLLSQLTPEETARLREMNAADVAVHEHARSIIYS